jgi:hypothetical protein
MNRKPIFDAVRTMLGRGFEPDEVKALDLACDLAEAAVDRPDTKPAPPAKPLAETAAEAAAATASAAVGVVKALLGKLSEKFESGGKGPGTVSTGSGDPGGVSYGVYQLSSRAGTLTAFLKTEGKPWVERFGGAKPGSAAFSAAWKTIAGDDETFGPAQNKFIERTHYLPAVVAAREAKGLDLDTRCTAVREATWSIAVQHGKAAKILIEAINICDRDHDRAADTFDRALVEALYQARTAYVLGVAENPKLSAAERKQLVSITRNRFPAELKDALALLDTATPTGPSATPSAAHAETIDGNAVAAREGVRVKSNAVKISRLHPKMEPVIVAVAAAARKLALPQPVITSGNDSQHMKGSLHFKNRALDFRGNNIQPAVGKRLESEVRAILGQDYDVAFELFMNASNNHLHVEYDPD